MLWELCEVHHPVDPTDPSSRQGEDGFGRAQQWVSSPLDVTAARLAHAACGHCPAPMGDEEAAPCPPSGQHQPKGLGASRRNGGAAPFQRDGGEHSRGGGLSRSHGAGAVGRFVPV